MTDKVQKIKDWISKEQDGLVDAQGNFEYPEHEGAYHILCNLDTYIDSLQEELVSEELENNAIQYAGKHAPYDDAMDEVEEAFKAGAKWKEQQMMKSAKLDGWIARDEDDRLHLFEVEPRRLEKEHRWWDRDYHRTGLDESDFPDLKWEDEPIYVKLIIIKED